MGYRFVGFKTPEGAKKALKSMQGFVLAAHVVHVKFAGRGKEEEGLSDKVCKLRSTKHNAALHLVLEWAERTEYFVPGEKAGAEYEGREEMPRTRGN